MTHTQAPEAPGEIATPDGIETRVSSENFFSLDKPDFTLMDVESAEQAGVLNPIDAVFLRTVLILANVDSNIFRRVMSMRVTLNNDITVTEAKASELIRDLVRSELKAFRSRMIAATGSEAARRMAAGKLSYYA